MRNYPEELAALEEVHDTLKTSYAALQKKYDTEVPALKKRIDELEAIVSGAKQKDVDALDDTLRHDLKKHRESERKRTPYQ